MPDPKVAAQMGWKANREIGDLMDGVPLLLSTPDSAATGEDNGQTGAMPDFLAPVGPAPVLPIRAKLDPAGLGEIERAVVAIMADGRERTGDIVAASGEDTSTTRRKIHATFNALGEAGWIVSGGHGRWQLTPAAQQALKSHQAA